MKTRQSFVANSSSSSFIIAFKNPASTHEFESMPDWAKKQINSATEKLFGTDIVNTIDEMNKKFVSMAGYRKTDTLESVCQDPDNKETYDKYVDAINNNYSIAFLDIDNGEDSEFYFHIPSKDKGNGMYKLEGDSY